MKNCKASVQISQRTNLSLAFQKIFFLLCLIFFHISPLVCEGKAGRRGGGSVKWIGGLPIRGKTKKEKQIIDQIEKRCQQHSDSCYDVFVAKLFPTQYSWNLEIECWIFTSCWSLMISDLIALICATSLVGCEDEFTMSLVGCEDEFSLRMRSSSLRSIDPSRFCRRKMLFEQRKKDISWHKLLHEFIVPHACIASGKQYICAALHTFSLSLPSFA